MTYVTDDELESMQSLIDAGEPLSVDEAQHLIAEVRRLRAAGSMPLCPNCEFSAWECRRCGHVKARGSRRGTEDY